MGRARRARPHRRDLSGGPAADVSRRGAKRFRSHSHDRVRIGRRRAHCRRRRNRRQRPSHAPRRSAWRRRDRPRRRGAAGPSTDQWHPAMGVALPLSGRERPFARRQVLALTGGGASLGSRRSRPRPLRCAQAERERLDGGTDVSGHFQPVFAYVRRAVPMWVGTIFIVAGSTTCVVSVGEWRAEQRFERDAVTAQAAVVDLKFVAGNREGKQSTRYLLTYRLTPHDGAALEQTEEIPLDTWESLTDGDTVTVRYAPDDLRTARTGAAAPGWQGPLVAALTGAFVPLGLFIALPGWRRVLAIVRVQRSGAAAQATVVEVAPAGVVINRVPQWRIKYEFRD